MSKPNAFRLIVVIGALSAVPLSAFSQESSARVIRIITGYASGGISSPLNRKFADELAKQLKQPVIVEDKPGANNVIGARAVIGAPPDGHTLHIGGLNPHPILQNNGVDLAKELEPVGIIAEVPLLFVTTATKPLKSLSEVTAFAKANPGRLDFASSGGGGHWNLKMGLLANRAGNFTHSHVPYKGGAEVQMAISRGDVHITLLTVGSAKPLIDAGKGFAILMAAPQRSPLLPNVPTPAELGLKPVTATSLFALWAPKGTPLEVIRRLNTAMVAIARDPAYIEWMRERTGTTPPVMTPEQTRAHYESQVEELEEAARITGHKAE